MAAYFGLRCYAGDLSNCNILLRIDNTTAIAYVNRMGGTRFRHLSRLAKEMWAWSERHNLWIFASYISSKDNSIADFESRRVETETEFELSQAAFELICMKLGRPEIDLFASRANAKCRRFVSWRPDPYSIAVNAFTMDWAPYFFYAFPPFSLILKTLKKVREEEARGILVVPYWPSQAWYPRCRDMFESDLIIFKPEMNLVSSSNRELHPLWRHLSLAAGVLSHKHVV